MWTWLSGPSKALVAFFPFVSIEDRPLLWTLVRSQTYYSKHILVYGSGKTYTLLSWVPALSGPTVRGGLWAWRSKHHTDAGPAVLGAWSPSLDEDLDLLTGVERVGLACAWSTSEACVSGYLAGLHYS
jgi:hypothetical protein